MIMNQEDGGGGKRTVAYQINWENLTENPAT
jgi:hypothetical protein